MFAGGFVIVHIVASAAAAAVAGARTVHIGKRILMSLPG